VPRTMHEHTCAKCGNTFTNRERRAKYCSPTCLNASRREPARIEAFSRARALLPREPIEVRFWRQVDKTPTCWLWTGTLNRHGYGQFSIPGGKHILAHRYAYQSLVGPIPEGRVLDHVKLRGCTSPACVNPDHLEPVTQAVNVARGKVATATHCRHGHPYDEKNTRLRVNDGKHARRCRTCHREDEARRAARKRIASSTSS
jgi:hypothetical protein